MTETPDQRAITEQRITRATRMRIMGYEYADIGADLGITASGAYYLVQEGFTRSQMLQDIPREELRCMETMHAITVRDEAWRGWRRSMEDAVEETVTTVDKVDRKGNPYTETTTTKRTKGQSGSAAHLAQVNKSTEIIGRLNGLFIEDDLESKTVDADDARTLRTVARTPAEAAPFRGARFIEVAGEEAIPDQGSDPEATDTV